MRPAAEFARRALLILRRALPRENRSVIESFLCVAGCLALSRAQSTTRLWLGAGDAASGDFVLHFHRHEIPQADQRVRASCCTLLCPQGCRLSIERLRHEWHGERKG